jgi:tol-pal system beta propeller repeat protein TolB
MKLLFLPISIILFACNTSKIPQDKSVLLHKIDGKESAYPRLSKDDKKILYQSNQTGNWQLIIMDIKSGTHHPVMSDTYNNNFPDWSYDNEWIAFTSDRDGNEEIYVMKTDGSDITRITNDPSRDIHPYFSPDGKHLLFNSTRANESFDIYKYTFSTNTTEQLTGTKEDETCARYSPDMKHMVFLKNDHSTDDVFLLNMENGSIQNISKTPEVTDGWPMFSFDNQWIYYSSYETGVYCIYRIKLDGSGKEKLTTAKEGEEDARISISRNGSWLIYNKRIGKTIEIRQLGNV